MLVEIGLFFEHFAIACQQIDSKKKTMYMKKLDINFGLISPEGGFSYISLYQRVALAPSGGNFYILWGQKTITKQL